MRRRRTVVAVAVAVLVGLAVLVGIEGRPLLRAYRRRGEIPVVRSWADLDAAPGVKVGDQLVKLGVDTVAPKNGVVLVYAASSGPKPFELSVTIEGGPTGTLGGHHWQVCDELRRAIWVQSVAVIPGEQVIEVREGDRCVAKVTVEPAAPERTAAFLPVYWNGYLAGGVPSFAVLPWRVMPCVEGRIPYALDPIPGRERHRVFDLPVSFEAPVPPLIDASCQDGVFTIASPVVEFQDAPVVMGLALCVRLWIDGEPFVGREPSEVPRMPPSFAGGKLVQQLKLALDLHEVIATDARRVDVQFFWSSAGRAYHPRFGPFLGGFGYGAGLSNRVELRSR